MPQRTRLASAALLAGVLCLLTTCHRPPFSEKIDGDWSGSTSDQKHALRFSVKTGKIHEIHLSVGFAPPPAVMGCNFNVTFTPDAAVAGRDFTVEGTAQGMLLGLAGRSDKGRVTVELRGTFTSEDAASGQLTLSLDKVPGCAFENREHVLQWNARRLAGRPGRSNEAPTAASPVSPWYERVLDPTFLISPRLRHSLKYHFHAGLLCAWRTRKQTTRAVRDVDAVEDVLSSHKQSSVRPFELVVGGSIPDCVAEDESGLRIGSERINTVQVLSKLWST